MSRGRAAAAFLLVVGVIILIVGITLVGKSDDGIADARRQDQVNELTNSMVAGAPFKTNTVREAKDDAEAKELMGWAVTAAGGFLILGSIAGLIAAKREDVAQ